MKSASAMEDRKQGARCCCQLLNSSDSQLFTRRATFVSQKTRDSDRGEIMRKAIAKICHDDRVNADDRPVWPVWPNGTASVDNAIIKR